MVDKSAVPIWYGANDISISAAFSSFSMIKTDLDDEMSEENGANIQTISFSYLAHLSTALSIY